MMDAQREERKANPNSLMVNRKGLSRQKIVSYLESNYGLSVESGVVKAHIKRALSVSSAFSFSFPRLNSF